MLIQTERFEMRLSPDDRERLDRVAAQASKSRAEVFKSWLRSAESPPVGDSGAGASTFQAAAPAPSDHD